MGQGSGLGAQGETGQEAGGGGSSLGWLWVWASLGSLSKYGRFFCLHLSHAGHGPRDLLSRYCRRDCASPAGPTLRPHPPSACGSAQHPSDLLGLSFLHQLSPVPTSLALEHPEKVPGPRTGGNIPSACTSPTLSPRTSPIQLSQATNIY